MATSGRPSPQLSFLPASQQEGSDLVASPPRTQAMARAHHITPTTTRFGFDAPHLKGREGRDRIGFGGEWDRNSHRDEWRRHSPCTSLFYKRACQEKSSAWLASEEGFAGKQPRSRPGPTRTSRTRPTHDPSRSRNQTSSCLLSCLLSHRVSSPFVGVVLGSLGSRRGRVNADHGSISDSRPMALSVRARGDEGHQRDLTHQASGPRPKLILPSTSRFRTRFP
jgi:hypothetical protein